jgi:hypothetical protein
MKRWLTCFSVVILVAALFFQLCCTDKNAVPEKEQYASLDSSTSYVGMETCKGCHQDIYNTYIRTGMGLSIDKASRKKTSAVFEGHPRIYDKYHDLYYEPLWKNDSLVFHEFRLEGRDTVYQRSETITYIIGSGQHTNSHIYNVNGYLQQAPMTYYTQQGRWDFPPGFENGNNTRFERKIGLECLSCHNGYPKLELGSENKYAAVPRGIDCERCHGPGSKHVAEKQSGDIVDISKQVDYSIVNPAKLPIDLQFDVCQRCHIQGNAVLNEGKSFYDFRPGMKLSDVMNVFMPLYKGNEEEHIMASHAERLKQSRCYLSTTAAIQHDPSLSKELKPYRNALTCVTCHNPHISRLETPKEHFNQVCTNCHSNGKTECKEDLHIRLQQQDNCVKCHMPENGAIDIPHVRVHDHKIRIPLDAAAITKIKEFAGIIAVNNPHPPDRAKAAAFINYFEKFGMGQQMLDSALHYLPAASAENLRQNFSLLVRVYFLKGNYNAVTDLVSRYGDVLNSLNQRSYSNDDAWTCYRIGEAFKLTGAESIAEKYYRRCYELAPRDPSFANEYGEILAVNGNLNDAIKIFKEVIEMDPKFAPPYANLGYIYLSSRRDVTSSAILYDKALALDPDYVTALLNKAALKMITGDNRQAVLLLKKVLKLQPTNEKAAFALKQLQNS